MTHSKEPTYKYPVLLVEDEKDYLEILEDICDALDIPYKSASTGSAALELINAEDAQFSVFIVDLNLPGIHGKDLIVKIKEKDPDAIVIVQTGNITSETIIQTMKLGVFDYILKPIDFDTFQQIILKALNYKYLINQEKQIHIKSDKIIRDQIDWINYKNSIEFKNQIEHKSLTIDHMITSLSQGAGLGSAISLLDLLHRAAKKTPDGYLVPADLFDLLYSNQQFAKTHFKSMSAYMKTMSCIPDLQPVDSADLIDLLSECRDGLAEVIKIKNHSILIAENKKSYNLKADKKLLKKAFREVFINAMKYSPENSEITVMTSVKDGFFWFSFKNDIMKVPDTGIPEKFEKLILEPFFRISKAVDERYVLFEDYSIGLGLPSVESLFKKNNGMVIIHEVDDFTNTEKKRSVLTELLLPID